MSQEEFEIDGKVIPGSWKNRRKVIFSTLVYCGVAIGYLLYTGDDTLLNQTIAAGLMMLSGGTIGSYVFGAIWDDRNLRTFK